MISSTMPSTKYPCSGSPLRLSNGSTAIDGPYGGASRSSLLRQALRRAPDAARRFAPSDCCPRPRDPATPPPSVRPLRPVLPRDQRGCAATPLRGGLAQRDRYPWKGSLLAHRGETDRTHKLWKSLSLQFLRRSEVTGLMRRTALCRAVLRGPDLVLTVARAGRSVPWLKPPPT